ncbi:glycosyl hydrolase family 18 protein [Luteipulveratus flavus]|uniref:Glycosyl hydrolase family 18 protein n=1 Tax=Luteipulveratus flavus TaxID=3031728 RepID=A0ABT6C5E5_9MICO|nr:glycosyl hydrolase family 18 protein [Luteipulveratus sp. YIM 133296]MDF8263552.1 glycosyl hydrolase family 18 protein [Luteipulveratus sp. YIM 133296]
MTAFQDSSAATSLIDRSKAAITTVGVDGVTLAADGTRLDPADSAVDRQRARTRKDGLKAELLVSNFSSTRNDFSEPIAHTLLSNPSNRARVVKQLTTYVTAKHWDGISIDLESLRPRDSSGLIALLRGLRASLPAGATLSISLMAATTPQEYVDAGYDLTAIGRLTDRVMLMTYDQHGPWDDEPGPIGALSWQRAAVNAVGWTIPRNKLDLGVAGYAYVWKRGANDMLSVADARKKAGSRARFDVATGEWTARLADGSVLWWSDARSYALRVKLAQQLGVHGLAMWVLGMSDPLTR